jgi:hypothetical protein
LLGFTLVYGALMVADVYLLQKFARAGSPGEISPETIPATEADLSFVGSQS